MSRNRSDVTRPLGLAALALAVAVACTAPQNQRAPQSGAPAGSAGETVRLGGEPTGAGTYTADLGEVSPPDPSKLHKEAGYSPYAGRRYPTRPFFGDEHVHTGWSADAGAAGATLGPEEATRFARGEEVTSSTGQPAQLGTPLDWVAITDHSDGMGVITEIKAGNPEL